MSNEEILAEIASLEKQLTGNMMQDMNLKDEIHRLTMIINGTKPTDSTFFCEGCGS